MENTEPGNPNNNNKFQILVDSDAFVGWMMKLDAHHERAEQVFDHLKKRKVRLVTTSFVVAETATVLSHRKGQTLARTFLDDVVVKGNFPVIFITKELHQQALDIFKKQDSRGTSVTDCANVAVMRRFTIPSIFSFDKVYSKTFGLKLANS